MTQEHQVFLPYYINNIFSSMIRGYADYFSNVFFERSNDIVIATYEKGVQHFLDRGNNAGEKYSPKFPYIVFDPGMDFEPDPQAGRFFHGYPNFMGGFATTITRPYIYEDDNIVIGPILNRYKGRFDLVVWCSSIYELMDYRMQTFQLFGGLDRIIYPKEMSGFIVLPDEVLSYVYENKYTGNTYSLDWENNSSEVNLIKNINQQKMVFPFQFMPWIKLVDCGDGAQKYGGSGQTLSDHRLNIGMEWECSVPTHMGMIVKKAPDASKKPMEGFDANVRIHFDMDINFQYSIPFYDPDTGLIIGSDAISREGLGVYTLENPDIEGSIPYSEVYQYKDRYNYFLTQEDENSILGEPAVNFTVDITDPVEDPFMLKVYGKFGELKRDQHWTLKSPGVVEFISFNMVNLRQGDNLWFVVYEKQS